MKALWRGLSFLFIFAIALLYKGSSFNHKK